MVTTLMSYTPESDAPAGDHLLFINDASFDQTKGVYRLVFTIMSQGRYTGTRFSMRHMLRTKDGAQNSFGCDAMFSLTQALYGPELAAGYGILNPGDYLGGLVCAEVKYAEGSKYANVYSYRPVDKATLTACGCEGLLSNGEPQWVTDLEDSPEEGEVQ